MTPPGDPLREGVSGGPSGGPSREGPGGPSREGGYPPSREGGDPPLWGALRGALRGAFLRGFPSIKDRSFGGIPPQTRGYPYPQGVGVPP